MLVAHNLEVYRPFGPRYKNSLSACDLDSVDAPLTGRRTTAKQLQFNLEKQLKNVTLEPKKVLCFLIRLLFWWSLVSMLCDSAFALHDRPYKDDWLQLKWNIEFLELWIWLLQKEIIKYRPKTADDEEGVLEIYASGKEAYLVRGHAIGGGDHSATAPPSTLLHKYTTDEQILEVNV